MKLNILDCSLRDGGYYNNWNFDIKFVNKYLKLISKSNINYIEIGFKSLINDKEIGLTGKCDDEFINKLNVPRDVNLGVMINSSEFVGKSNGIKAFFKKKNNKIKFVRLATHIKDILKIGKAITWLKKNGYIVADNIMQISEIKSDQIKIYCNYLRNNKVDILYFADSLGCLRPNNIKSLCKVFRKYWNGELGIHAHDNLGLALNNSQTAHKNGVRWIDSTILGMGRGPGNTKTEDYLSLILSNKSNISTFKKIDRELINLFKILKKRYKWGTNKYYRYSGQKKIHPTYIQEILSNRKNKKNEILSMLKGLTKLDVKKYNPLNMYFINNFTKKNSYEEIAPKEFFNNKKVLIVGPGNSVNVNRKKIKDFILKQKLTVIYTNKVKNFMGIKNYYRIASHPLRLITDFNYHLKNKDPLILPVTNIPQNIFEKFKKNKKKMLNFGLEISKKNSIRVGKSSCSLPEPLIIGYSLCFVISGGIKKIYLTGFDGFKKDDPYTDTTQNMIDIFTKKLKIKYIKSLTKTDYKLN